MFIIKMEGVSNPLFYLNDFDEAISLFNACTKDFKDVMVTLEDKPFAEMDVTDGEEKVA